MRAFCNLILQRFRQPRFKEIGFISLLNNEKLLLRWAYLTQRLFVPIQKGADVTQEYKGPFYIVLMFCKIRKTSEVSKSSVCCLNLARL